MSLATADALVGRLRAAVESTGASGFGAFAGIHPLDDRRLLAASTDSVGTKLILARERGALRKCGADLAAHCINDVITCGAEPLMLLDYVAANRIDLEQVAELVEGAAEVCRAAGCALVGGETAELPGVYREDELDFAGTCVGVVDRDALLDGSKVEAGDVVVGLPSAGVHANGFTLVRRILEEDDYDGDDLLAPTRLYLDDVRRLRPRAHAFAHVTGGGIAGNVARVVPDGLRAEIDWEAWERPPVFRLARAPRRRGRVAPRLQPRHRLLRDRRGARRRRARHRQDRAARDRRPRLGRRDEPAGADRRRTADRRSRVEPPRRPALDRARSGRHPDGDVLARLPRDPRGARPRHGDVARGARGRARRPRRVHAPADARRSSIASRTAS